jgi:hypothetical protein
MSQNANKITLTRQLQSASDKIKEDEHFVKNWVSILPNDNLIYIVYNLIKKSKINANIYGGSLRDYLDEKQFSDIDITFKDRDHIFMFLSFLESEHITIDAKFKVPTGFDWMDSLPDNISKQVCYTVEISGNTIASPIQLDLIVGNEIPFKYDFTVNSLGLGIDGSLISRSSVPIKKILNHIEGKELHWCGVKICDTVPQDENLYTQQKVRGMYGGISYRDKFYFTSGKYIERLHKMISKGYTQSSDNLLIKQRKLYTKINTDLCTMCKEKIKKENIILSLCEHIFCYNCLYQVYKQKSNTKFEEKKQSQIEMKKNEIDTQFQDSIMDFIHTDKHTDPTGTILDMLLSTHRTAISTEISELEQMESKTLAYVDVDCPDCKLCLLIVP